MFRKKIRNSKAQLELNLDVEVKENKKLFYKYVNSKRSAKENLRPLLFRTLVEGVPWNSVLKNKGDHEGWTLLKKEVIKAQE